MSQPLDIAALPKRFFDDMISRKWAEVYAANQKAGSLSLWTAEDVDERMVDAVRLVQQVAGPIGPKVFGRGWPEVARNFSRLAESDDVDVDSLPNDPSDIRPSKPKISQRRVSEMEAALYWPALYLADNAGCRNVFNLWLRCKAHRKHFRKAVSRAGWNEATAKRRRWQASLLIATGLMRAGAAAPSPKEDHPRD